jgi:hypothetical protein
MIMELQFWEQVLKNIDGAEDRNKFSALLDKLELNNQDGIVFLIKISFEICR